MGAHHIRENEATQQRQTTYDFDTHEDWNTNNLANDICWVHLPDKVTTGKIKTVNTRLLLHWLIIIFWFHVDSNIQTITLQTGSGPEVGEMVQATGWGRDSDAAGGISEVLREVSVPVMSNEDCDAVYSVVNDGHICIDSKGGKGTCNVRFS